MVIFRVKFQNESNEYTFAMEFDWLKCGKIKEALDLNKSIVSVIVIDSDGKDISEEVNDFMEGYNHPEKYRHETDDIEYTEDDYYDDCDYCNLDDDNELECTCDFGRICPACKWGIV